MICRTGVRQEQPEGPNLAGCSVAPGLALEAVVPARSYGVKISK